MLLLMLLAVVQQFSRLEFSFLDIPEVKASSTTFEDLFLELFPKWRTAIHAKFNVTDVTFHNYPWFGNEPTDKRYYLTGHALSCLYAYEFTGNSTYLMEAKFFIEYLDQYVDSATESLLFDPSAPTAKGWFFHDIFMWMAKYKLDKLGYYDFDTSKVVSLLWDYANLDNSTDLAWSYFWTQKRADQYVVNTFTAPAWFLSFLTNDGYGDYSENVSRIQNMADRFRATDYPGIYQYEDGSPTTCDYHYSILVFNHLACAKALDSDGIDATRLEEVNQQLFNTTCMALKSSGGDRVTILVGIFSALAAGLTPPCYPYLRAFSDLTMENMVFKGFSFSHYSALTAQFYRLCMILGMFPDTLVPTVTRGYANKVGTHDYYFNTSFVRLSRDSSGVNMMAGGHFTGYLQKYSSVTAPGVQWNATTNQYYWTDYCAAGKFANETASEYGYKRNATFNQHLDGNYFSGSINWGYDIYIYASNGTEYFVWDKTSHTSPAGWVDGNNYTIGETWILRTFLYHCFKFTFDVADLTFNPYGIYIRFKSTTTSYQMESHNAWRLNSSALTDFCQQWVQGTISTPSDYGPFQVDMTVLNIDERFHTLGGLTFYTAPDPVATITSASYSSDELTMTINATSGDTTTTYVHCGSKGEPSSVSGASWSYSSTTNICTLSVTHSSAEDITLSWVTPSPPDLYVYVIWDNGTVRPHLGVTLTRQGFYWYGITDTKGTAVFTNLVRGTYKISVGNQSKKVNVRAHHSVMLTFKSEAKWKKPHPFKINPRARAR